MSAVLRTVRVGGLALAASFTACSLGFGENFSGGPAPGDGGSDASSPNDAPSDGIGGGDADPNEVTRGLHLSYRFDETTGDVVLDSAPKMNHAKLVAGGAGPPMRVAGARAGALSFASSSRAEAPYHPTLLIAAPFTVAMWVSAPAAAGTQPRLLAYGDAFNIKLNNRGMQLTVGNQYAAVDYQLPPDRWTHYAVVFANGYPQWYVDGVAARADSVFDGTLSVQMSSDVPILLANSGDLDAPYTGMMDDVRVYSVALTAQEVGVLAKR